MQRILLFAITNLAVLFLLGIIARLLGADRFLVGSGLNITSLLIFAAIFGMGGSFISLLMSKWIAKRSVGAQVIEQPRNQTEQWLVETVRRQAQNAGIGMPEVAIYDHMMLTLSPPARIAITRWSRSALAYCSR